MIVKILTGNVIETYSTEDSHIELNLSEKELEKIIKKKMFFKKEKEVKNV